VPRKPSDKVIEYRHTLGTFERERLDSLVAGFQLFLAGTGINRVFTISAFDSPTKMILWIESIATLIEVFGFETPIPTPVDAYDFIQKIKEKFETEDITGTPVSESGNQSVWDMLTDFWFGRGDFEGLNPGGY